MEMYATVKGQIVISKNLLHLPISSTTALQTTSSATHSLREMPPPSHPSSQIADSLYPPAREQIHLVDMIK